MHVSRNGIGSTLIALVGTALVLTTISDPLRAEEPGLANAEFAQFSKQLQLKNQPWTTIPWKVSVTEARLSEEVLGVKAEYLDAVAASSVLRERARQTQLQALATAEQARKDAGYR